jgi:hypothetical protein
MEQSASGASNPFQAFDVVHRVGDGILNAWVVGSSPSLSNPKPFATLRIRKTIIENASDVISIFDCWDPAAYVYSFQGEKPFVGCVPPRECFSREWFINRCCDETGILEVNGVFLAAPFTAP